MKKAIVTGANGFIGTNLVKELVANRVSVVAVVRGEQSNTKSLENLPDIRIVKCPAENIEKLPQIVGDSGFDAFFHLAWNGSAGEARGNEKLQLSNIQHTVDSVRVARELECGRFIGSGSIMEKESLVAALQQGSKPGLPYIYGIAKLAAHQMSKVVSAEIGIEHEWALVTNAYGEGEVSPRFINTTIRKILRNEPLVFTSAKQNYDFVYVTDVAKALYCIALNGKPYCEYLIGSSNARPLREFIEELIAKIGNKREAVFGDIPYSGANLPIEIFDTKVTESDTGFRAAIPFDYGITRAMDWMIGQNQESAKTSGIENEKTLRN
jgi:nucleoside-diphosphate-sugar epimerase